MSWLNLNDSLNNLKGQISSFANNVLADEEGTGESSSSAELGELQKICTKQQEEINFLQKQNAELRNGGISTRLPKNDVNESDESWSWEVSDGIDSFKDSSHEIISNLKKTISQLQNEKQELTSNLVLLDSEHQTNTEKLINMKNKLQKEYDQLEHKYNQIKEQQISLAENRMKDKKELEDLKVKYQELSKKAPEPNSETNEITACTKCEKLQHENRTISTEMDKLKSEISILKSNNVTLQRVLDDSKAFNEEENAKLEEKLKLYESENKILVAELKKATQSIFAFEKKSEIDAENCKKLASILDGYEEQVSSLKEKLSEKNSQSTEDFEKLKKDFEEITKQLQHALIEKEQTHSKYINILTENMKRYVDGEEVKNSNSETDPQVLEFNHQVESILNILLDLKVKCESLENELYNVSQEKTNILSEKNHEIEKLIQNSEILSQEVITKSQTIKDYENECNELIKNNGMLISELKIFKNNSGLQTISESNEDNILLLESQLENANKKIEELEIIISENENSATTLRKPEENDEKYVTKASYDQLLENFNQLTTEKLALQAEKQQLVLALERMKTDLENVEYQYTEMKVNIDILKEDYSILEKRNKELGKHKEQLDKQNTELERNNEDTRSELNDIREKLLVEEDARKHCESQIRNLTEKLQNAKMCETSLKLQYDTISKELNAMTDAKSTLETSLKKAMSNLDQYKEDSYRVQEDNYKLRNTIDQLEHKLAEQERQYLEEKEVNMSVKKNEGQISASENDSVQVEFESVNLAGSSEGNKQADHLIKLSAQLNELQNQYDFLVRENDNLKTEIIGLKSCEKNIGLLEQKIQELEAAKNELTNVIITKHQESVTYHNEIQRLTQILNAEAEKNRNLEAQLQALNIAASDNTELQKKDEEIDKLSDQNSFLREKCEVLAQNLLEEQSRVQQILAENSTPSEREQALAKKIERLQAHLIEVEEHYTQELLRGEERNAELQAKVSEIEQREKNSSTMYTSVSIRANQHVETLQHQLQLITNQRDELRKKISDAEDHSNKQEVALANLQFVLEQFQKDRDKDIQKETERIRRQINIEKKVQEDLRNEISGLHLQLEESKHGLLAASRLSDQLEQSKHLVNTLKAEVSQLEEKLQKSEEKLCNLSSQSDGKVDKSLIKNLIIGFVTTNNNLSKDQTQILKIIATVLDFNQHDRDKVNLSRPQQGWLGSLLSPQTSQGMSQESLSQAFVKFLENESKPRLVPSLLNTEGETPKSRKNSTVVARQSPSILSEMVLPTFADFAQNRNSSSILKDVLKDNS